MKKGLRKFFAIMLSVAMICTYSVTAFAAEGDGETTTLKTEKSGKLMMTLTDEATLDKNADGAYSLTFYMDSTSYDKVYPDTAKKAVFEEGYKFETATVKVDGAEKSVRKFVVPVEANKLNKEFIMSAHSVKNEGWYERIFNIDTTENKLVYKDAGNPMIKDDFSEIPWDESLTCSLGMFQISSSRSEVNADGTVTVTTVVGNPSREFSKIALIGQDASDEEKEAVKIEGTKVVGSANNEYEYEITVPVEKIGEEIPFSMYQTYKGSSEWKTWSTQHNLTINPTPSMSDQFISQIYVQKRNEYTDKMCEVSKKVWDALTDEQKEDVEEGDYYARPTGDASKDNPLNQDGIGNKELLVVSFGTSFNDSRVATIGGIEKALAKAFPEYSVRRAFTAQIIINHIQSRDNEVIDNMQQAMDRAVANGVKELVLQPTHLMHGYEYDEMMEVVENYRSKIDTIKVAEPLLNTQEDKELVADAVLKEAVKEAGYASVQAAADDKTAFIFMGHGTSHASDSDYADMQNIYKAKGFDNVFVGTVEGEEKDDYDAKALSVVKEAVKEAGFTNVVLRPLMVVAGDHANNDMADEGDEEAWAGAFKADGFNVTSQIAGLGQIEAVQNIYVEHTAEVLKNIHNFELKNAKKATCTAKGYTGDKVCTVCGHTEKGKEIAALGHKYVVTKAFKAATTKADGNKEQKTCSRDKKHVIGGEVIKRIGSVTLSKTAYTYDGNTHKPVVTVKDRSGNKISTANYTVTYKNYKSVGKATATVTFKNNYKGTVTKSFKINPRGTKLVSVARGSKSFTAKWNKQSTKMSVSRITGYQVKYATNSSMTSAKTVTVKGYSTTSKKISSLRANKKYYVMVRTYKVVNDVKYYSAWSAAKTVTTK